MKTLVVRAVEASLLLAASIGTSQAGLVFYTNRVAWAAAAGTASFTEDFSSFTADASFQTAAVALQGMSIRQEGVGNSFRNTVDVPPLTFVDNNGTANASMYTDFGATTVRISFNALNSAYGAESWAADDNEGSQIEVFSGTTLLGSHALANDNAAFLGYVLTGGTTASSVVYASVTNLAGGEGFGLDNLAGVNAIQMGVPEPESITLLGLGIAALWVARQRRKS